jgi:hypothetical protein
MRYLIILSVTVVMAGCGPQPWKVDGYSFNTNECRIFFRERVALVEQVAAKGALAEYPNPDDWDQVRQARLDTLRNRLGMADWRKAGLWMAEDGTWMPAFVDRIETRGLSDIRRLNELETGNPRKPNKKSIERFMTSPSGILFSFDTPSEQALTVLEANWDKMESNPFYTANLDIRQHRIHREYLGIERDLTTLIRSLGNNCEESLSSSKLTMFESRGYAWPSEIAATIFARNEALDDEIINWAERIRAKRPLQMDAIE